MKCAACNYDTTTHFLQADMMLREEDRIAKPFIPIYGNLRFNSNHDYYDANEKGVTIHACPKCGTLKIEVD